MSHTRIPVLVAHRGYPSRYPENSIPGLDAAIHAGACFVEFDIQLSRDRIPVLCHDASLLRTAGIDRLVMELSSAELDQVDAGEQARLGARFKHTPIPKLTDVLNLLSNNPTVHAFVEIKQESLDYFGHRSVMEPVMTLLNSSRSACTVISFNADCLREARQLGAAHIGFVTEDATSATWQTLDVLKPDFLFTSERCFDDFHARFTGSWRWAVYHTENPERARQLTHSGADLVETNAIGEMLKAFTGKASRNGQ